MKYLKTYETYSGKLTKDLIVNDLLDDIKRCDKDGVKYDKQKISEFIENLDIDKINNTLNKINMNELYVYYPSPMVYTMSDLKKGELEDNTEIKPDIVTSKIGYKYLLVGGDVIDLRFVIKCKYNELHLNLENIMELVEIGSTIEMDGFFVATTENNLKKRLIKEKIL